MRITGVLLILLFFAGKTMYGQLSPGAAQISMSNSDAALCNDVFALFNNAAGLAQLNWREAGLFHSPSPFGFKELSGSSAAYSEPLSFGSLSAGVTSYGFDLYKELKVLTSLSYNYNNTLFTAVTINYHTVNIKNYGSDNSLYFNLSALAYLNDFIRMGFTFININRATFGKEKGQIPVIVNAALSFDASDMMSLNIAFSKDLIYKPSLHFGICYELIEYITLRTGFVNEPARYSGGVGINYLYFNLDYAVFTHTDLGLTHQAGLIISFGKDEYRSKAIRKYLNK